MPREILKCAAELFEIFEKYQFVLQLGMQASMRDHNAHYPLNHTVFSYCLADAVRVLVTLSLDCYVIIAIVTSSLW